jgi:dTDP-L-rhamnose 4-epimerase
MPQDPGGGLMRVLVTGGAGFVGSAVVDLLVSRGHCVRVLDNLSRSAHAVVPAYLNPEAEYVWSDVGDVDATARAVAGVDAVSHQAARVGLGVNFRDVTAYVQDNDTGTAVLLRCLYERHWQGRLVLASSMVVYGEGAYECAEHGRVHPAPRQKEDLDAGRFDPRCPRCGATPSPVDLDEGSPLDPRSVYAATKLHQEHLCQAFAYETGSSLCALRYHNVYGPRMPRDTPYAGVASIFRSAYERDEAPLVYEDGGQRRDFIHVTDVALANEAALLAPDSVEGPFNVATGEVRTVAGLAQALGDAYGPDHPEAVVIGRYRLADVRHVTASPERARRLLSFQASVPFERGMAEFATAELRAAALGE